MTLQSLKSLLSGRSMRAHVNVDMQKVADSFNQETLLFESLHGEESLSSLPHYSIQLIHRSDKLNLAALLGKNLTVEIDTLAAPRFVGGLITQARLIGPSDSNDRYFSYAFNVSPCLWLTTLNQEYRIYQELSVPQIISAVLDAYTFDAEFNLLDTYSPRPYCVQYGESDFHFISRLLEEEGIHYYFQYSENKHTLVMSDDLLTHTKIKGYEEVPYYEADKWAHSHREYLSVCQTVESLCSNKYSTNDYNFLKPYASLNESTCWPAKQAHHPPVCQHKPEPTDFEITYKSGQSGELNAKASDTGRVQSGTESFLRKTYSSRIYTRV